MQIHSDDLLLVIDMQIDFCTHGKLAVASASMWS
jgi:nicotinamidase-related amidase